MTRNLFHRLSPLFAACTLVASAGAADTIVLWEHANYRGASVTFDRAVPRLGAAGWNDRASSLRVESGRWEICRDDDFRGCRMLSADMGGLATLDDGWNDVISSVRPVGAASDDSPEGVARRLYRAILGREADAGGLRNATTQVERRQTESLVRGMMQSSEYRDLRSRLSTGDLLDQYYQGLWDRSASSDDRRAYGARLDRGEDVPVLLEILDRGPSSSPPGGGSPPPSRPGEVNQRAPGAGFVIWGANGRYESLSGASVSLRRDGSGTVQLDGTTPQTFDVTWSWDRDDLVRLRVPTIDGQRADADGIVQLDRDRLARVEITAGTPGARNQVVFSFLAGDYRPPRVETECIQRVRDRLEGDRGAALVTIFLAPEQRSVGGGREELTGIGHVLANPKSFRYRCAVDSRGVVDTRVE